MNSSIRFQKGLSNFQELKAHLSFLLRKVTLTLKSLHRISLEEIISKLLTRSKKSWRACTNFIQNSWTILTHLWWCKIDIYIIYSSILSANTQCYHHKTLSFLVMEKGANQMTYLPLKVTQKHPKLIMVLEQTLNNKGHSQYLLYQENHPSTSISKTKEIHLKSKSIQSKYQESQ